MKLRTIYHPLFERDADEAKAWYDEASPGLGTRIEVVLERCVTTIEERPLTFQLARGRLRCAQLKSFPCLVVFAIDSDRLLIAGVFHGARDRAIWDTRT